MIHAGVTLGVKRKQGGVGEYSVSMINYMIKSIKQI